MLAHTFLAITAHKAKKRGTTPGGQQNLGPSFGV